MANYDEDLVNECIRQMHAKNQRDIDELVFKKDREEEIKEVLQTLEKLYNDFTMRPDECKALDFAINFIKEKGNA